MIFKYSSQKYSNIRAKNIRIFEQKIFEYSYSVHCGITNIFVFVFGPKYDSEYIRIRIRAKKNIPNIFVFVFGPKKNIRYALSGNKLFGKIEKHLGTFYNYIGGIVDMVVDINDYNGNITIQSAEKFF